jgi:hypothetical protein
VLGKTTPKHLYLLDLCRLAGEGVDSVSHSVGRQTGGVVTIAMYSLEITFERNIEGQILKMVRGIRSVNLDEAYLRFTVIVVQYSY